MNAFERLTTLGFERVSVFYNRDLNVHAIVAVHDTTLGPSLGGCRMKQYSSFDAAFDDALRLAEGMTYKNSLAGLSIGGGKSVIVRYGDVDPTLVFPWFGHCVETFNGSYITAEDMGTSVEYMRLVQSVTAHVSGTDPSTGGGGDPSPYTARGVFQGMRAILERVFPDPSFQGKQVAIQGVGHVGWYLAKLLHDAGAQLVVSDVQTANLERAKNELGARVVGIDEIYDIPCDIFAPCAVGGIINSDTIPRLTCRVIAGAANNQLLDEEVETTLAARSIFYAPDFAINSGGVILCADEREPGGFNPVRVGERVDRIYETIGRIFDRSSQTGELTGRIALSLAKERIELARKSPP